MNLRNLGHARKFEHMDALTTAEIAVSHRVSVRTVHRMRSSGELVAVQKLPGKTGAYLFDRQQVIQAFEKREAVETAA